MKGAQKKRKNCERVRKVKSLKNGSEIEVKIK